MSKAHWSQQYVWQSGFSGASVSDCSSMASPCVVPRQRLDEALGAALEACTASTTCSDLPTELCDQVAAHLSINDLLRLVRVRRSVLYRCTPLLPELLYENVRFVARGRMRDGRYQMNEPPPSVDLLLRSLLRRPSLSGHTKRFTIVVKESDASVGCLFRRFYPLADDDYQRAMKLLHELDLDEPAYWIRQLRCGRLDVMVGLLMSLLRNLEVIAVPPDFHRSDGFFSIVLRDCSTRFKQLSHVDFCDTSRKILWTHKRHQRVCSTTTSMSLLYASRLETLSLMLPYCWSKDRSPLILKWPTSQPPVANKLYSLILRDSQIAEATFGQLLACCPCLAELTFEYDWPQTQLSYIDAPELGLALRKVSTSLRKLTLKVDISTDEDPSYLGDRCLFACLGDTFRSFPRLTYLDIAPVLLFGWSPHGCAPLQAALPPNIESLYFHEDLSITDGYVWREDDVLNKWIHFLTTTPWRETFPNLSYFQNMGYLDFDDRDRPVLTDAKSRCIEACREHGIDFRLYLEDELYVPP